MAFSKKQEKALEESTRMLLGQQQPSPEDEDGPDWGVQMFKMICHISKDVGSMESSARSPSEIEGFLVECVDGSFIKNYVSHTLHSAPGAPDTFGLKIDNKALCEDLTLMAEEFSVAKA